VVEIKKTLRTNRKGMTDKKYCFNDNFRSSKNSDTIQNVDFIISLFSQKFVYFLQDTGVNIYVLFLFRRKKKTYLVILSDCFYIKFYVKVVGIVNKTF
jgi:mevalonate pyrophosphate decarboxylase